MPATSAKQKRFMTMVKARKSGHDVGGPSVQRAAATMSMGDVSDFADAPVKKTPARSTAAMKKKLRRE